MRKYLFIKKGSRGRWRWELWEGEEDRPSNPHCQDTECNHTGDTLFALCPVRGFLSAGAAIQECYRLFPGVPLYNADTWNEI